MAFQYEAPVPHSRQDSEPRVDTTQWVAIGLIIATFLLLSAWLIFIRGRYLRSRRCVEFRQTVARDGTECVAGYRRRIWHAKCHATALRDGRLAQSDKARSGVGAARHTKGQEDTGVNRSDSSSSARTMAEAEKGQLGISRFGAGDRPRLSVLVGPRPNRTAVGQGESSDTFDTHTDTSQTFQTWLARKTAPIHQARQGSHVRGSSVASHAASIGVVPILLREDDHARTSHGNASDVSTPSPARVHSRPGSVSSRSSIAISLPASPREGKRESLPPLPVATDMPKRQETAPTSSDGRSNSKRQSVLRCDTASVHSVHSTHSVHRPSPLRTSVAGLPELAVPAVPELPVSSVVDGATEGRMSRSISAMFPLWIKRERSGVAIDHADGFSGGAVNGKQRRGDGFLPERSSSLLVEGAESFASSTTTNAAQPIGHPPVPHITLPVHAYHPTDIVNPSQAQVPVHTGSPTGQAFSTSAGDFDAQSPPRTHMVAHRPRIDFARPSSVDWRDSVNIALQRAGDSAVDTHAQTHEHVSGPDMVHAIGTIPMPDPARYSLKPSRRDAGAMPV